MRVLNLVVEGGGLRGVFTAGILDEFIDNNFFPFQNLIGVSAGAINLAYYLSRQAGVFKNNITQLLLNPKFIQLKHLLYMNRNVMDLDWFFDYLRENHPIDFQEIRKHNFFVVCTNIKTGKPEHITPSDQDEMYTLVQSSCATPLYYKNHLLFKGQGYVDGALADPLPIAELLQKEGEKTVVIRNKNNSGKTSKLSSFIESMFYIRAPHLRTSVKKKHLAYENLIASAREKDNFLLIEPMVIRSSFAKSDFLKIQQDYNHGREIGIRIIDRIKSFSEFRQHSPTKEII